MINAAGGINGRKVTLVSLDDAFTPAKTVQQTRKLVEDDDVLAIVGSIGTPTNLSVAKYLNSKQVPQILLLASTPKLDDPENLPWTTTFMMPQPVETRIYAEYLLKTQPNAKIAVIYQNDDLGKGNLSGFKTALGSRASTMVVADAAYDIMEPTVDSQILALKASGADTLFHASNPRFAAQAIRKAHELGWKVQHVLLSGVSSISAVLRPGLGDCLLLSRSTREAWTSRFLRTQRLRARRAQEYRSLRMQQDCSGALASAGRSRRSPLGARASRCERHRESLFRDRVRPRYRAISFTASNCSTCCRNW